jgi:7-cyano-7-deazaguanine synthase
MTVNPTPVALLLSGGMDSTTLLWWMKAQGMDNIHTLAIDYGQRHRIELMCSEKLSQLAGARSHRVLRFDLGQIGGNPLTDPGQRLPAATEKKQINTVVPYRNMLFVTLASAWAETQGISNLYLSPVRDDFDAYRDCRRVFYDALEKALSLGASRETQVSVHTPFIDKWKHEVVRIGLSLKVPYADTLTCYQGTRPACGKCDACAERISAFEFNEKSDPLAYLK